MEFLKSRVYCTGSLVPSDFIWEIVLPSMIGSCDQKPKNLDSSTISHPNFYDKCVFTTLLENFNGFQIFVRNVNTSKYRNGSSSFYKDLWTCKVIRAIFIWSIFKRAVIDHMTCYNLSWPKIKF